MDHTLTRFVSALRNSEVEVSPAETLDAMAIARHVGISDPVLLRDALRLALAKSSDDKRRFDDCFQRFFGQLGFRAAAKQSFFRNVDRPALLAALAPRVPGATYEAVRAVLEDQRDLLALRVQQAAARAGMARMRTLREKSSYARAIAQELGVPGIDALVGGLGAGLDGNAATLRYVRHYLSEQITEYVETQYRIQVDASGKKAIIDAALQANLATLPPAYEADVRRAVQQIADKLARQHRRRKRQATRGQLDLKRTLRHNVAYDGTLFDLHWQRKRRHRPTLFALCDVSGSVSRVARFLLLMLYHLSDVLPDVRAFAFSSELAEITDVLKRRGAEEAIEEVIFDWGRGNTDYGRALGEFRDLALHDIDRRSTVIILGDARSNYYDAKPERLKEIARRARQVLWLNPEAEESWGTGDSEMARYAPHCFQVARCRSLADIRHLADKLVAQHR
jgi:uncharacterized protein